MDPAAASVGIIRRLADKADDASRVIRAYHGSPHSFSRFDASKIGTGEGAQAYGHGLYFAGNEDVADTYRSLAGKYPDILIGGQKAEDVIASLPDIDDRLRSRYIAQELPRVASWVAGTPGLDSALIKQALLKRMNDAASEGEMPQLGAQHLEALLQGKDLQLGPRPGHMYEVEIGHPEESLLDWDAAFARQPATVQSAFGEVYAGNRIPNVADGAGDGRKVYLELIARGLDAGLGADAAAAGAARQMRDAGIPGIRYLDAGSRSAGRGTRNYVVFPGGEDRIKILRQYGLLPPLMAPALMEDGNGD